MLHRLKLAWKQHESKLSKGQLPLFCSGLTGILVLFCVLALEALKE